MKFGCLDLLQTNPLTQVNLMFVKRVKTDRLGTHTETIVEKVAI